MKLPFFGPSYVSRAIPMAVQECINWYFEPNESQQGEQGAMIGTPGTVAAYDLSSFAIGRIRGQQTSNDYHFVVVDNAVIRFDTYLANPTLVGYIPSDVKPVSMAENGIEMVIAHTGGWSVYNFATGAFADVPDAPVNSIIAYIDSYIVGTNPANGTYVWSNIANALVVDGLSFASAEGAPDFINSLIVDHRELLLFGLNSLETLYNTENAEAPFQRSGNSFIEHGCIAPYSVAKINNTVVWLGADKNGAGIVSALNGGAQQRLGTHALEYEFSTYGDLSDAIGFSYQEEGHSFYVLSFPTANKTWCYDFSTQYWHQRAYRDPNTGELQRIRANNIAYLPRLGKHVIGDYENPMLYFMALDNYSDDGNPIYRARSFMVPDADGLNQRHHEIEVFAEGGNADDPAALNNEAKIWLERSIDYGRSYKNLGYRGVGKQGNFQKRSIWKRLGIHRHAAYRVCVSSAIKWTITKVTGKGKPLTR